MFSSKRHFLSVQEMDSNVEGYDLEFTSEPPDALMCLICTFVARDPQQMVCCGRVYCQACLLEHKKHSDKCPQCRESANSFPDRRSAREIKALKVKCNNLDNGCQWTGELRCLEEHLLVCDYEMVPCSNECKEGGEVVTLLRKDLKDHLESVCNRRDYKCPHCENCGEYEEIVGKHLEVCPKVPINCPNTECPEVFERWNYVFHLLRCEHEPIPCKYSVVGCNESPRRKDLRKHQENVCPHRDFECPHCMETGEYQERTTTHLETCPQIKVKCRNNQCMAVIARCEIFIHESECDYELVSCMYADVGCEESPGLRKDIKKHEENECPRRQYECPHCKETGEYQEMTTTHLETCPQVKVPCPNDQCQVSIPRCEVFTHRSATCDYKPVPCKYAEVGCEERPLRKDLEKHEENKMKVHLQMATKNLLKQKEETRRLDTEVKQLKEKLKEQTSRFEESEKCIASPQSRFTFKVTSFNEKREGNQSFYSSPFHSSKKGYKLSISVYANEAEAKGTHVSVFAYLMKGDNDDSLSWPFTGTITIELLNQLEDKNHFKVTVEFTANDEYSERVVDKKMATVGWGCPQFISYAKLPHKAKKNRQYLKDDTLVFRVSVQVPDYKPWLECSN